VVSRPRPHDLLVCKPERLRIENDAPGWVAPALRQVPIVVVRQAAGAPGMIPVGIRGNRRTERFACFLCPDAVGERVTPEQLARARGWAREPHNRLPAFAELPNAEAVLSRLGVQWGPAGSVAFELVSGEPAVTLQSDLDLLIRLPQRISSREAARLEAALRGTRVRVDVRAELPGGFVALAELSLGRATMLLRTDAGPVSVSDPWDTPRREVRSR